MGNYATLTVKNFDIAYNKSYIDPIYFTLFREMDREISQTLDDDEELWTTYQYTNSVKNIKLRLNIMGFTLGRTRDDFDKNKATTFESIEVYFDEEPDIQAFFKDNWNFDTWLASIKKIINSSQGIWELEKHINPLEDSFIYYIVKEYSDGDSLFGFNCSDIRYVIRGILEAFEDDDEFYLEYSDLVDGGYVGGEDKLCESALDSLAENYIANEKIIILTEGSTDISIIQRTMKILYPDVYDFYSFMDFNTPKAAGSASSLVSYVKAFIGSGIRNKVIALFDNDTAAKEAMSGLSKIKIPNNIKVLCYPNIDYTVNYPTLGPHGVISANINGLACSIELYLGREIITNPVTNEFYPVQWKGFSAALNQYQGEILNKDEILKNYFNFLDSQDPDLREGHDWEGMNKVLEVIFKSFE
jgi:hypothetical protein